MISKLATVIVTSLLASSTFAATPPSAPPVRTAPSPETAAMNHIKALDTNKDNELTMDEFLASGSKAFKRLDMDGNGKLSAKELTASYSNQINAMAANRKQVADNLAARAAAAKK